MLLLNATKIRVVIRATFNLEPGMQQRCMTSCTIVLLVLLYLYSAQVSACDHRNPKTHTCPYMSFEAKWHFLKLEVLCFIDIFVTF